MPITDENYFRKYLDDPATPPAFPVTPLVDNIQLTETADTTYFRKYLDDPAH